MLRFILIAVLCGVTHGQPFPYVAPVSGVSSASPLAPVLPPAYPQAPSRPLVPNVAGYNNPYYNQYTRSPGAAVPILTYSSEHVGDGTYSFSFSTADGKQAQEAGYLKDVFIDNVGEPQGTQVVQGSYSYVSPEGTPIQVSYIADENGFRPSGVHIPADGKAAVPIIGNKERQILDPFNRYDPFNNLNRYNTFGKYPQRYDPRYRYDGTRQAYDGTRHPYDGTRVPFDNNRYNYDVPRYNNYNRQYLAPAILGKNSNDSKKTE